MTHTPIPETPDPSSASQGTIDQTRRKLASAGLGGSAVLLTLASRPVLGATCLTPSAAGSGNHSQHNPIACTPQNLQYWIDHVPRNSGGQVQNNTVWPGTTFKPGDAFHPLFTKGPYLNFSSNPSQTQSYSLWEVLSGTTPNAPVPGPTDLGKWFVAGLLNASANYYAGVIQPTGPDPSVRGIEDEFATNGYFQATAGKQWGASTIIAYLQDPGSVF